jgi:hypothetical protein
MPLADFIKYPIFLKSLLNRIYNIKIKYDSSLKVRIYKLSVEKVKAQKELHNKGGIYLLWCRENGLFYVGSALRFFTKEGRLNDYFMVSRIKMSLAGISSKISKDLAKAIDMYSIYSFMLIIIEEYFSDKLEKPLIQSREQFWMLLYPTFNRSLLVSSNDHRIMLEKDRVILKNLNIFYQYEVEEGKVINKRKIFGMKELSRTGVIDSKGKIIPIEYNSLKGHKNSGLLWKDRFLFSSVLLNSDIWKQKEFIKNNKKKGVWIYDYTTRNFITFEKNIKICLTKYNISSTHFYRIRKFGYEYKGKLFSNKKL